MKNKILNRLQEIEREHDVVILYACESGSRAWGFESLDSDYDVRFIYKHKVEWYLSIEDKPDYINDVGKVLDFGGWELKKALKLFKSSNSSLFEKLLSPFVYMNKDGFAQMLNEQGSFYFNPVASTYHYSSLVKKVVNEELSKDSVKLKRCFYAVRSVLCARWVLRFGEPARMELAVLQDVATPFLNQWIDKYLPVKKEVDESFFIDKQVELANHLKDLLNEIEVGVKQQNVPAKASAQQLDKILMEWISKEYLQTN